MKYDVAVVGTSPIEVAGVTQYLRCHPKIASAQENILLPDKTPSAANILLLSFSHEPHRVAEFYRVSGRGSFAIAFAHSTSLREIKYAGSLARDANVPYFVKVDFSTPDVSMSSLEVLVGFFNGNRRSADPSTPMRLSNLGASILSDREVEILKLAAEGTTNIEIADILGLTEKTAKNHFTRIFSKLNVSDRAQAVAYALRKGLID